MEVESSPITAAQHPAFRHPSTFETFDMGNGVDFSLQASMSGGSMFGSSIGGNFGVPDPTKKTGFDLEPRGMESSPTSSLAADLSQNFHIDRTPHIPTPRRALFQLNGGSRTNVTTPPILSSSPGHDSMDISPLPHKAPYGRPVSPPPRSPTDMSMDMSMEASLPSSPPEPSPAERRPNLFEKKKAGISRPSLLRNSRFTTGNALSFKSASKPISFNRASTAPQINLQELFSSSSPPRGDSKFSTPPNDMLQVPRFTLTSNGSDGSPVPAASRRCGVQRPRGKVRRTASMFENAQELLDQEGNADELMSSPMSPDEEGFLPCWKVPDDPLSRISKATLCKILDGKYAEHFDELVIVDCRFEYEYNGGHIDGAINLNSLSALEEKFLKKPRDGKTLIVFHCEYSAHRAPRMALHLRKRDREVNMARYPILDYPDIFVLAGGYSSFFNEHRHRCDPPHYIEMNDSSHTRTCEKEMSKFRRHTKVGFARTQSLTLGFDSPASDISPSAGFGRRTGSCGNDSLSGSPFPRLTRADPRRTSSY